MSPSCGRSAPSRPGRPSVRWAITISILCGCASTCRATRPCLSPAQPSGSIAERPYCGERRLCMNCQIAPATGLALRKATPRTARSVQRWTPIFGCRDIDSGMERLMYRAFVGDFHQPLTLAIVECAFLSYSAIDMVDFGDFAIAVLTILRMNLFFVVEPYGDILQGNFLEIGVKPNRHRRTGTKSG